MSNCDVVTTINFNPVLKQHMENEADITLVYSRGVYDYEKNKCTTVLEFDGDNRLKDVLVDPQFSGECNIWLEMCIITKDFLKKIVSDAASRNQFSFTREILQGRRDDFKIMGYKHDGFFTKIDSIQDYYLANRMLLDPEKKNALFRKDMPVLTKIGDNGPVKYGLESSIKDSLIADGCIIEGTVINSILFRGVKVGKDSVVKDCVLLQGTKVGENCSISSVIADKNVEISNEKVLTGSETYPLYIGKGGKI
jgi:glucose-1-phosphate adenylyltransferase